MNTKKFKSINYFFSVILFAMLLAACSDGSGGGTNPPPVTTPTIVPNAPTNVKAEAKSSTSILVSWSSVSGATSYEVHCETGSVSMSKITTVTGTSYTHADLKANTTYKYYITAKNSAGTSDYSSPASATTSGVQKPTTPTYLTAAVESSTSIRLTWNPVAWATSYDVYYTVGSSSTKNYAANLANSPYVHTGLQPDTTYYYCIKAKNSAGESDFSSSINARIRT
jgi:fibronectin type 3 domain-containing protein